MKPFDRMHAVKLTSVMLLLATLVGAGPLAAAATGPKPPFLVAGLKLIPKPGDKAGNYAKFEQFAREAAAAGAKVLVTSECYLDGYENNVFVVLHSPFNSVMVNPAGDIIAHNNARTEEGIVYARIDLNQRDPEGGPMARRRPELYQELTGAK